ncbi:hypothetical protein [Phormidium nigroviride]
MSTWQFWWQTVILSTQHNPPRFVELVMLTLAMILLLFWSLTSEWPYLVLSLSYVIGSSISILVREALNPSSSIQPTQVTAVLLLMISFYSFAKLLR